MATYQPRQRSNFSSAHQSQSSESSRIVPSYSPQNDTTFYSPINDSQEEWIIFNRRRNLTDSSDDSADNDSDHNNDGDNWHDIHEIVNHVQSNKKSPSLISTTLAPHNTGLWTNIPFPNNNENANGNTNRIATGAASIMPQHDGTGNFFENCSVIDDDSDDPESLVSSDGLHSNASNVSAQSPCSRRKRRKQRPPILNFPPSKRSSSISDGAITSSGDESAKAHLGNNSTDPRSFLKYLESYELKSPTFSRRYKRQGTRLQSKKNASTSRSVLGSSKGSHSRIRIPSSIETQVPPTLGRTQQRIFSAMKSFFVIDQDTLELFFSEQYQNGTWGEKDIGFIHGLPQFLEMTAGELGDVRQSSNLHSIFTLQESEQEEDGSGFYLTPPASRESTPKPDITTEIKSENISNNALSNQPENPMSIGFEPTLTKHMSESFLLSKQSPFKRTDDADAIVDLGNSPSSYLQAVWSLVRRKVLSMIEEEDEEDHL